MKREEVLKRLGFDVPANRIKRVIVHSDIAAEADDYFAVAHHLLSPTENVVGIIAANFEWRFREDPALKDRRLTSMEESYEEGKKLLSLMGIDDVPIFRGAPDRITDPADLPDSEGSRFIIEEALRESEEPLYIALQGGLTDLAVAYLREPRIAECIAAAIWIGGAPYPDGGAEYNLRQDVYAAQVLFRSPMPIWQIPANAYAGTYLSLAEIVARVKPCGGVGQYLTQKVLQVNHRFDDDPRRLPFPHGEVWSIGDQPTVTVLLESDWGARYHQMPAPEIREDMSYAPDPEGKYIRVYDEVDKRLTMGDLLAKLELCCRPER